MIVYCPTVPTLTKENKQTLKALLSSGRWNNESEVLRYGLHLVTLEAEQLDGERKMKLAKAVEDLAKQVKELKEKNERSQNKKRPVAESTKRRVDRRGN